MSYHKSNLESLHKAVPKRLLPSHLGGDAGPIEDIASKTRVRLDEPRWSRIRLDAGTDISSYMVDVGRVSGSESRVR